MDTTLTGLRTVNAASPLPKQQQNNFRTWGEGLDREAQGEAPQDGPTSDSEAEKEEGNDGKKPEINLSKFLKTSLSALIAMIIVAGGSYFGYKTFLHWSTHEETDDAYVTGHLHQVSTRVNGTVKEVLVDDNEHVKEGQVIVLLDPRDYQVRVDQALAALSQAEKKASAASASIVYQDTTAQGQDTDARGSVDSAVAAISRAKAQVREATANIEVTRDNLQAREAELLRATTDYNRYVVLEKEGAISKSERDAARRDYSVALGERNAARSEIEKANAVLKQAEESVTTSQANLRKAEAQMQLAKASTFQTEVTRQQFHTDLAAVNQAKAALDEAKLNLSYTRIVAPTTGRVGKKAVERGQRIEPGQPLLTIVADKPWVVANFKETQLKKMHSGQHVEIKIDSFPDHHFEGIVQSFSPASGASFAILPSDNATGNFTKIVQRVPVKILFTEDSLKGFEDRMAPGLSAVTTVDLSPRYSAHEVVGLR